MTTRPPYAILRAGKINTVGSIAASLSHCYRTRPTPNADPSRAHQNINAHELPDDVMALFRERISRLKKKPRKDAVLLIEYMIGHSGGHFQTQAHAIQYLNDALEWVKRKHGPENVVSSTIHLDETTPHMHVHVVPITPMGNLAAKYFLDGSAKMSAMQTAFWKDVAKKYGLERGVERSTAKHTSIKEWYGLLNESMRPIEIPPTAVVPKVVEKRVLRPDVVESPEEIAARLNRGVKKLIGPIEARAKMADLERSKVDQIRRQIAELQRLWQEADDRARQAEDRARAVEAQAASLRQVYAALTPAQQKNVVQQAKRNMRIRERCERLLSNFYDGVSGAVGRFWKKAKAALLQAKGQWWDVPWANLEEGYVTEERPEIGFRGAFEIILEHSPGHANTTPKEAEKLLEMAAARDLDDQRRQGPRLVDLQEDLRTQEVRPHQVERPRG